MGRNSSQGRYDSTVAAVVVWLDPGGTTGIAMWRHQDQTFGSRQDDFPGTGTVIETLAATYHHELDVGYESYHITPGSHVKHDGSSLRVIGMVEWLVHKHRAILLPSQQPSARRVGLLNLKTVGWFKPGKVHANDAASHLLVYLLKRNQLPQELKERIAHGLR